MSWGEKKETEPILSQLGDQDYANLGLPQEEERVLDEERTEEAFTIHQSQLLKHRTIEDMFFSNNNINQLMIFQTSKSSRCRSKCVRFKQVRFYGNQTLKSLKCVRFKEEKFSAVESSDKALYSKLLNTISCVTQRLLFFFCNTNCWPWCLGRCMQLLPAAHTLKVVIACNQTYASKYNLFEKLDLFITEKCSIIHSHMSWWKNTD